MRHCIRLKMEMSGRDRKRPLSKAASIAAGNADGCKAASVSCKFVKTAADEDGCISFFFIGNAIQEPYF